MTEFAINVKSYNYHCTMDKGKKENCLHWVSEIRGVKRRIETTVKVSKSRLSQR